MDEFKTLTFYPWGPTAPSSSHPQQVLVFCSTHDRPVYKINTFNNAIDVSSMGVFDKDGDYQCIAQYPLWLQSWPISQWEKNLLATHSPTRKTLSIGSYDFEWRLAEVGGSPRYDIIDDGYVLAYLRVDQGYVKVDVRAKYKVHMGLCDGIIRAIVVMSARRDAWLQGANIRLG